MITCSSQDILTITKQDSIVFLTPQQLKYTNYIFAEHKKLFKENFIIDSQLRLYKEKIRLYEVGDSLQREELTLCQDLNNQYLKDVQKKSKMNLVWKLGCVTLGLSLLLVLIFK